MESDEGEPSRWTQALPKQRLQDFTNMIRMVDIRERPNTERQMEEMKDNPMTRRDVDMSELSDQLCHVFFD
jgi:hypothetical protein